MQAFGGAERERYRARGGRRSFRRCRSATILSPEVVKPSAARRPPAAGNVPLKNFHRLPFSNQSMLIKCFNGDFGYRRVIPHPVASLHDAHASFYGRRISCGVAAWSIMDSVFFLSDFIKPSFTQMTVG
ncbi:hypothetical protein EVAR_68032_1 [Eumeta japonica]|uniref:Uncharacterized protein n=1 Tax=Eumeta variegata TaxID=151549 RepID=A0A4C1SIR1_EUMVA|nr:hypothetical protein EVAR_68032_1 [Eumeta japonica]